MLWPISLRITRTTVRLRVSGEVGSRLLKRYPDFDVRSYGTNQLTKLLGEFSSVQITKDGNSVMVELTESSAGSRRRSS